MRIAKAIRTLIIENAYKKKYTVQRTLHKNIEH
jgi:predicted RNA-binding protein YlqC (UPF0109 family)